MLFLMALPMQLAAQDTTAPYIWWYADTHDAFVIERADGSDSRFVAAGINPEEQIYFEDTAFSPSGEWLAWRSDSPTEGGVFTYTGYIVRVDGSEQLHFLDSIEDIQLMRWSPTHDWLFIAYHDAAYHLHLMVIDVNDARILTRINLNYSPEYGIGRSHYDEFHWSADGEEAYYDSGIHRFILDGHGQVSIYPINQLHASADEFIVWDVRHHEFDGERWHWITNTILQNVRTGQQIILEETPHENAQYAIFLNPLRTHLLVDVDNKQTRLIDLEAGTMISLHEGLTVRYCEYRIECGNLDSIPFWSTLPAKRIWSADGRYALLAGEDQSWHLLDANSGETEEIVSKEKEYLVDEWQWVDQNRELIFMSEDPFEVHRYSIDSGELTSIVFEAESYTWQIFPSPNGHYLGRTKPTDRLDTVNGLLDTVNGQEITWIKHSASQCCGGLLSIDWHSDSEWFFTTDDTLYAGGGVKPSARSIHHVNGIRRELGDCFGTCIGFLPVQVSHHLPTGDEQSVVQEPFIQILHEGQVYGVVWSPDGTQIISYEYTDNREAFLTQWDISGQQPKLVARSPVDNVCTPVPFGCRMIWQADNTILINNYESIATFDLESHEIVAIDKAPDPQYLHSPDGRYELSGLRDNRPIRLHDTTTSELLFELEIRGNYDVAWASDNQTLFLNDYTGEANLFWDGTQIHQLENSWSKYRSVLEIDYHPQSGLLVGGSFFMRMQIWDVSSDKHLASLNWNAWDMAFSPDGTRLAAAGTRYITLWDMTVYQH